MCDDPSQDRDFSRRDCRLFLAVFAAALAVRLFYLLVYSVSPYWDALVMDPKNHWDLARRIAEGRGLGPYAYFRAPLYLYVLAGFMEAFGEGLWPVRVFQALVGAGTAALTYRLARFYLKRPAALAAGMVQALYWLNVYFDGELLTENLATFLGLAGLTLLAAADRRSGTTRARQSYWYYAFAGLALGLSAITRPNALVFAATAAVILAARALRPAIALALGVAACVAPVTARNLLAADDFVLIASQGGINFWIGNHESADGRTVVVPVPRRSIPAWFLESRKDHPWFREDVWLCGAYGAEAALQRRVSESEISAYWYGEVWAEIRGRPGRAALLLGEKVLALFQGREIGNNRDLYYHRDAFPILRALSLVNYRWIAPLMLAGLVLAARRFREFRWPLLFFISYGATVAAFFVTSRYRAPMLPAGLVLAGHCLETVLGARRLRAAALLAAAAALANMPWPSWNDRPLRSAMHYNLGIGFADQRRWEGAEVEFRKALEIKAEYPEAHYLLGRVLMESGRAEEAAAEFEACAGQAPAYAPAYYGLYEAYRALGLAEPPGARREEYGLRAWEALRRAHDLAPSVYPAPPPRGRVPGPGP